MLGLAGTASIGALLVAAAIAVFAPLLSDQVYGQVYLDDSLIPPFFLGGDTRHILGTDRLGKDVLLQLGMSIRLSALIAAVSVLLSGLLGAILGMFGGIAGKFVDFLIARVTEAQMALPLIVMALVLASSFGASVYTVVAAVAISGWVPFSRLVRGSTLVLRESGFVTVARVSGAGTWRIVFRHLVPNLAPSVIVLASQQFAVAVIEAAGISFLGVGVQPPLSSLGSMIGNNQVFLLSEPWLPLIPIVALAVIALSVNKLGDLARVGIGVRKVG